MYLKFYNLKKQPFKISCDPDFFWFGKNHRKLLATLRSKICYGNGHIKLTGDVGTGKTTLVNFIVRSFYDELVVLKTSDPGLEMNKFYAHIANTFNFDYDTVNENRFIDSFMPFLTTTCENGGKVLIVVDEAQRMGVRLINEMLQWPVMENHRQLLTILFVGQNEFDDLLKENIQEKIRGRITTNCSIAPLDEIETCHYIQHRLEKAGAVKEIFDAAAMEEVFRNSKGYPRLTNVICDNSMLSAYVEGKELIDRQTVCECARQLALPVVMKPVQNEVRSSVLIMPKPRKRKFLYPALVIIVAIFIPFSIVPEKKQVRQTANSNHKKTHAPAESLKETIRERPDINKNTNSPPPLSAQNPQQAKLPQKPVKPALPYNYEDTQSSVVPVQIKRASLEAFISEVFEQTEIAEMMTRIKIEKEIPPVGVAKQAIKNPPSKKTTRENEITTEKSRTAPPTEPDPSNIITFIINKKSTAE